MKLRPLQDRIILKRIADPGVNPGGVIALVHGGGLDEGEVLAVGPGKRSTDGTLQSLDVKAGDRVSFGRFAGTAVRVDGVDLLVMREEDLFGIQDAA